MKLEKCCGCGGYFAPIEGPTHAYMLSSAACWSKYGQILAREYSNAELLPTHRLSVDAYAVQHPGTTDRRAIQSVGLHLSRLMLQLECPVPPKETNQVMLDLSRSKNELPFLEPPDSFNTTVADIPIEGSFQHHIDAVRAWAQDSWDAWKEHHKFIRKWVETARSR